MASTAPNVVSEPYPEARTFWPALVGGVAFVWACLHFALHWYWCAGGIVVFFAIVATLSKQATIDYTQRTVYDHFRLFGHRVVGTREFSFSDFEAIVYRYCQSDSGDSTSVGLRFGSGRHIWIAVLAQAALDADVGLKSLRGGFPVIQILRLMNTRANKSAAGNAGFVPQFAIEHHWSGVP